MPQSRIHIFPQNYDRNELIKLSTLCHQKVLDLMTNLNIPIMISSDLHHDPSMLLYRHARI